MIIEFAVNIENFLVYFLHYGVRERLARYAIRERLLLLGRAVKLNFPSFCCGLVRCDSRMSGSIFRLVYGIYKCFAVHKVGASVHRIVGSKQTGGGKKIAIHQSGLLFVVCVIVCGSQEDVTGSKIVVKIATDGSAGHLHRRPAEVFRPVEYRLRHPAVHHWIMKGFAELNLPRTSHTAFR